MNADIQSKMDVLLEKVVEKIDLEKCKFNPNYSYRYQNPRLYLDGDGDFPDVVAVEFITPAENDPESLKIGLQVAMVRMNSLDVADLADAVILMRKASEIVEVYNKGIAEMAAAAEKKLEEERKAREQREAERESVLAERRERLMTEFLGEKGRIRVRRSTTYQPVEIEVRELSDGTFVPEFTFINDHDWGRQKALPHVRSYDVKVGSRYKRVWDDGVEDLYSFVDQEKVKKESDKIPAYDGDLEL